MEDESCCEKRFFEEQQQVCDLLQKIVCTRLPTPQSDVDRDFVAAHSALVQIVLFLSCFILAIFGFLNTKRLILNSSTVK